MAGFIVLGYGNFREVRFQTPCSPFKAFSKIPDDFADLISTEVAFLGGWVSIQKTNYRGRKGFFWTQGASCTFVQVVRQSQTFKRKIAQFRPAARAEILRRGKSWSQKSYAGAKLSKELVPKVARRYVKAAGFSPN